MHWTSLGTARPGDVARGVLRENPYRAPVSPRVPIVRRGGGGYSGRAMAITVKYFASLRERMGRGEERLHPPLPATVDEVWSRVGGGEPLAGNLLTAVNLEYVDPDHRVADGDEVAFFPPVTGG